MGLAAVIYIGITIFTLVLSFAFKVAGKLRLSIPLIYFLVVGFFPPANKWAGENETLAFIVLYALIGLVVLSWIYSLVKTVRQKHRERQYDKALESDVFWQIDRARELGIEVDRITVRDDGTVLHSETGEPILPIQNHGRPL